MNVGQAVPLARLTTVGIGGPARYLALPADSDDVVRALESEGFEVIRVVASPSADAR